MLEDHTLNKVCVSNWDIWGNTVTVYVTHEQDETPALSTWMTHCSPTETQIDLFLPAMSDPITEEHAPHITASSLYED